MLNCRRIIKYPNNLDYNCNYLLTNRKKLIQNRKRVYNFKFQLHYQFQCFNDHFYKYRNFMFHYNLQYLDHNQLCNFKCLKFHLYINLYSRLNNDIYQTHPKILLSEYHKPHRFQIFHHSVLLFLTYSLFCLDNRWYLVRKLKNHHHMSYYKTRHHQQ